MEPFFIGGFIGLLMIIGVLAVFRPCGCPPGHMHGPHSDLCLDCNNCRGR
jgi:hypothetical protein